MNRRTFVGRFGGVLLASPLASFEQQPMKVWRVGFLSAASRQWLADDGRRDAFLQGMRAFGYVEGKNFIIEWRFADGNYDRLPAMAAELVHLNVDVIIATPSPAIRAAQRATSTIPIVFPNTGDPVGSGFVASLARPGSNLTGLSNGNLDISAKTLELLVTVLPKMSRVAILANPGSSTESAILKSINAAAQNVGVQVLVAEAHTPEEIESAFATVRRETADAIIIAADSLLTMQGRQIAELAIKFRMPSISQGILYAKLGGLMGYGQDTAEAYGRAAAYVDKILKGAKPADLPVEQPTKIRLTVNLRTAKALGLTIPQAVLARADEVIH